MRTLVDRLDRRESGTIIAGQLALAVIIEWEDREKERQRERGKDGKGCEGMHSRVAA